MLKTSLGDWGARWKEECKVFSWHLSSWTGVFVDHAPKGNTSPGLYDSGTKGICPNKSRRSHHQELHTTNPAKKWEREIWSWDHLSCTTSASSSLLVKTHLVWVAPTEEERGSWEKSEQQSVLQYAPESQNVSYRQTVVNLLDQRFNQEKRFEQSYHLILAYTVASRQPPKLNVILVFFLATGCLWKQDQNVGPETDRLLTCNNQGQRLQSTKWDHGNVLNQPNQCTFWTPPCVHLELMSILSWR